MDGFYELFQEVFSALGNVSLENLPLVLAIILVALVVVQLGKWAHIVKDGKGARLLLWGVVTVLSFVGYTFRGSVPVPEMFFSGEMLLLLSEVGLTAFMAAIGSGGLYNILESVMEYLKRLRG